MPPSQKVRGPGRAEDLRSTYTIPPPLLRVCVTRAAERRPWTALASSKARQALFDQEPPPSLSINYTH